VASSYNEHVAGEVRAELGRQNRSQSSLAVALGWSDAYFSRRLTGAVPFTTDDLAAIAAELGVRVEQFAVQLERAEVERLRDELAKAAS
jgi:transcriptional regulator with XRE-family HTH domain